MTQLAIKGHETRGKEVIEILEMFGGNNPHEYIADSDCFGFYVGYETRNIYYDWLYNFEGRDVIIFTLEEFLERFPYKVGDKVQHKGATSCGSVYEVENLRWKDNRVEYVVCILGNGSRLEFATEELQPYEEVNVEGKITTNEDKGTLVAIDLTLEVKKANEIEVILGDYEFVLKDGKTYFVKKNKYPKTYEECCEVLGIGSYFEPEVRNATIEECHKFIKLIKLKRCRDAYWKLAGEQMGLGKPWEPDWNIYEHKFCLGTDKDKVIEECVTTGNRILAFPTKEMRDVFYEYFKDLIESCKEML